MTNIPKNSNLLVIEVWGLNIIVSLGEKNPRLSAGGGSAFCGQAKTLRFTRCAGRFDSQPIFEISPREDFCAVCFVFS